MPAMIGAETLVPPMVIQLPWSYIATPVAGSPTAETSATNRFMQPGSCCHGGFVWDLLQPLPAPAQAVSAHPRVDVDGRNDVPPTERTPGDAAGNAISINVTIASFFVFKYPSSPELATTNIPG